MDYRAFAARVGPLEVPEGYTKIGQISANMGSVLCNVRLGERSDLSGRYIDTREPALGSRADVVSRRSQGKRVIRLAGSARGKPGSGALAVVERRKVAPAPGSGDELLEAFAAARDARRPGRSRAQENPLS